MKTRRKLKGVINKQEYFDLVRHIPLTDKQRTLAHEALQSLIEYGVWRAVCVNKEVVCITGVTRQIGQEEMMFFVGVTESGFGSVESPQFWNIKGEWVGERTWMSKPLDASKNLLGSYKVLAAAYNVFVKIPKVKGHKIEVVDYITADTKDAFDYVVIARYEQIEGFAPVINVHSYNETHKKPTETEG